MLRFPFIRSGLIFAIFPLMLAFVLSLFQGGSMFNESGGTGAYIWFMLVTVPIGLVLVVIGVVTKIVRMIRK